MSIVTLYTLASVVVVSLLSLIGVVALSIGERRLHNFIFILVALAIGALLGDAFIHLIPESFEGSLGENSTLLIILGILIFFMLEKSFRWHHIHTTAEHSGHIAAEQGASKESLGYLILASDGLHNLIDGIIIGASYLVSIETGVATTLAIILHELPQEIGDFGVLLHAGFTKARALLYNFASALLAVVGAVIVLVLGEAESFLGWAIPLSAGAFIYIAIADLIPELHKQRGRRAFIEILVILLGIGAMYLLKIASE